MLNLVTQIAAYALTSDLAALRAPDDLDLARMEVAATAQESPAPTSPGGGWTHSIALYLFAAGLDGEVTVKGVDGDVDASFSDIVENLEMGGMLAYRAETERQALTLDTVYMGLGAQKDVGPLTTDVDVDMLVVELDWCWRLTPRTDVFVGARYWGLSTDLALTGPGPGVSASADEDWVDPLVGARHTWSLAEDWSMTLRGDIGGFGVGSDFSWQAIARLNWQMTHSSLLSFGYRAIAVDFVDGSGTDEFRYDVTTSGFLAGVAFTF